MTESSSSLFDLDAERRVVGSGILNPACLSTVAHSLDALHFHDTTLRNVYDILVLMHSVGRDVSDLAQVKRELEIERKEFDAAELARCIDSVSSSTQIEHYASRVIRSHELRRIDAAIMRARSELDEPGADPESVKLNLESRISSSESVDSGIREFDEVLRDSIDSMRESTSAPETVVSFGIPALDEQFGRLFSGDLCIVGARPGVGKSKFGEQVAMHNGRQGRRVLIISIEMQHEKYGSRAILSEANVDGRRIRTGQSLSRSDWDKLEESRQRIASLPIGVQFRRKRQSVGAIRSLAKMYSSRHSGDLKLLIIDYLQLIRAENLRSPRHEQVTQISADLKSLALELNVPILAMCQLNRSAANDKPTMSQLRESGSIEQDADEVILLHRPDMFSGSSERSEDAVISVQKFRDSCTGEISIKWDPLRGFCTPTFNFGSEWEPS